MRNPIIPDESAPDFLWQRFEGLCYRTTRAILRARHLLGEGQTLAGAASQTRQLLRQTFPLDPSDPLIGFAVGLDDDRPPTAPFPDLPQHTERVGALHTLTAIELGTDPEDLVLFWFGKDHVLDAFPTIDRLIAFEAQFVDYAHKFLTKKSRQAAIAATEKVFGRLHFLERPDFARLPYSPLVEFASTTPEEDRALMVSRLERLAARARDSLDIRTEAAVLRSIAQIQGLTYQDVDNEKRNFREVLALPPDTKTSPPPIPRLTISSIEAPQEDDEP